jgi:hypothetical protein
MFPKITFCMGPRGPVAFHTYNPKRRLETAGPLTGPSRCKLYRYAEPMHA